MMYPFFSFFFKNKKITILFSISYLTASEKPARYDKAPARTGTNRRSFVCSYRAHEKCSTGVEQHAGLSLFGLVLISTWFNYFAPEEKEFHINIHNSMWTVLFIHTASANNFLGIVIEHQWAFMLVHAKLKLLEAYWLE